MIEQVWEIVAAFSELLVQMVPMPWRVVVTLFLLVFLFYLFVWRLLPWLLRLGAYAIFFVVELIASILLLPEYLLTRQMRRWGQGPIWGSYLYGDLLQGIVRFCYSIVEGLSGWLRNRRSFPWMAFFLLALIPLAAWYARPYLAGTSAVNFIDAGFNWWYRFEEWMLSGGRA